MQNCSNCKRVDIDEIGFNQLILRSPRKARGERIFVLENDEKYLFEFPD
jgi:hypothetical protein